MRTQLILAVLVLLMISSLGALPKIAYVGMSAILPGSGEIALGKTLTGGIMIGVDVMALNAWFATDRQKDNLTRSYKRYATVYAGAPENGTSTYYQHLQQYLSNDEFNQFQDMMARNYYLIYTYDPEGYSQYMIANTYGEVEAWNWQSVEHQDEFRTLRRKAQTTKMYQNLSLGVIILNRAVSMIDVALTRGDPDSGSSIYFTPTDNHGLMLNYRMEF